MFWNYDTNAKDKSISTKIISDNNRKVKTEAPADDFEGCKNEVE
jgi:hypothetical protein